MLLSIRRTFGEALKNFSRNGWLTVATVGILVFSLYVISLVYTVSFTIDSIMKNVQDKVNVSIYFNSTVDEADILNAKKDLEKYSEIKSVDYISRENALEDFKENNADEPVILQSLNELGDNPLLASLVVKATSPDKYDMIVNYVNNASFKDEISRVNYAKNKDLIDKLNSIVSSIRKVGIILAVIFALISILITFNTIRLTIYTQRKSIEVMRLVGASNSFIRLPFIFEGIIYGVLAAVISMLLLFISIKSVNPYISGLTGNNGLVAFYAGNFWMLFLTQALIGVILGVVSSWIAMRKYLKI